MQTYIVTRTMQYTETVEVQAETGHEAAKLSLFEDGVRNNDDIFIDIKIVEKEQQ